MVKATRMVSVEVEIYDGEELVDRMKMQVAIVANDNVGIENTVGLEILRTNLLAAICLEMIDWITEKDLMYICQKYI